MGLVLVKKGLGPWFVDNADVAIGIANLTGIHC